MNTLQINSKAAEVLSRATEKARQVKPRVRKTATYGVYEVEASDKSCWYTVTCNSTTKEITCKCKSRKPCYHISTIAPIHVYIARQRRDQAAQALAVAEAEAANWPVPVEQSEVPSFDTETPASTEAAGAGQDFDTQVQEVRAICASTTAILAQSVPTVEKCLTCWKLADEGFDGFCQDCWREDLLVKKDRADLFG